MPTTTEIKKEPVTWDSECLDRLYLNGYIPNLQMGGQLVSYLHHLGHPISSPAILNRLTDESKAAVKGYAEAEEIEIIQFERGERKDDVVAQ